MDRPITDYITDYILVLTMANLEEEVRFYYQSSRIVGFEFPSFSINPVFRQRQSRLQKFRVFRIRSSVQRLVTSVTSHFSP